MTWWCGFGCCRSNAPRRRCSTAAKTAGRHVYLGDFDSYLWLRMARNLLRHGTACDAIVAGECRDNHAHAPVGVADAVRRLIACQRDRMVAPPDHAHSRRIIRCRPRVPVAGNRWSAGRVAGVRHRLASSGTVGWARRGPAQQPPSGVPAAQHRRRQRCLERRPAAVPDVGGDRGLCSRARYACAALPRDRPPG